MKSLNVAVLTVVLSAVAVTASAGGTATTKFSGSRHSTNLKQYDPDVEGFLMGVKSIGMADRSLEPWELGFLLEISGIRVNTATDLGFLLEVSGLHKRSIQRSDAQILMFFGAKGNFTATDDLARLMAEAAKW